MRTQVKLWSWVVVAAGVLLLGGAVAHALELDAKSDEQKHRKNIAKQVSKYTLCLVKAITKCEEGSGTSAVECHADTGVVDYAGDMTLDPKNKQPGHFQDAIAKCDSKVNLSKKGNFYTTIGCPGDCNAGTAGTQQCANLAAFQASVIGSQTGSSKNQLGTLAAAIGTACDADVGGSPTDPALIECGFQNAATLTFYSKGLFKCQEKCENDYKDKKGDGGPNDLPVCNAGNNPLKDPNFAACDDAALAKAIAKRGALSPTNATGTLLAVRAAINMANAGLYDKDNPVEEPDTNVCGNCGNNVREGAEQCDGADNALCGGPACLAACTCPIACGNDIRQGNEECDGTDDQACPGACVACACP